MNFSDIWKELLEVLWQDKPSLLTELKQHSNITEYNQIKKTLNINVNRLYLKSVVSNNVEQIKTLFERMTQKPVSMLSINNEVIQIQIIKKINPRDSITLEEIDAVAEPISYQTLEQSFNDSIFIKQSEIENKVKVKTVNLNFYNKYLQDTKTLIFHKSDKKYNFYYLLGIITLPLIIPSIIYFYISINKQKRFNVLKRKINELIVLKYRAVNYHAKDFIKNIIK